MLPGRIYAASEEEVSRVEDQLSDVYWKSLSASGRSTLQGYCGILAGWELYYLGVTERSITHNGNQMYDIMSQSEELCEGYSAECYPASSFTIEEALNTITNCGTKDAYNIMVGFQWTNTAAGNLYGHVMVIHAVLDGVVYFTDCFYTPYNVSNTQAKCTIAEFNDYYNTWTRFEGLIHFGNGGRIEGCDTYSCDAYIASKSATALLTSPSFAESETVRNSVAGERLYATALCRNAEGALFYRVVENGQEYFVAAAEMEPFWFVYDSVEVTELSLPRQVDKGQDHWLTGVIRSRNSFISNIVVEITNQKGHLVTQYEIAKNSKMVDLNTNSVNAKADISMLPEGEYTYSIYCDVENHYYQDGEIVQQRNRILLDAAFFTVGSTQKSAYTVPVAVEMKQSKTGWQYENGSWYYYENGTARTGWFCYEGVDYYLQDNGSAATGWQNINGKDRYFSQTGAMRTGWLETENGTYYMLSNGVPAVGLIEIGESQFIFGEDGKMLTDTVYRMEEQVYTIDAAGKVSAAS